MSTISMYGHIGNVFSTVPVEVITQEFEYVDGISQPVGPELKTVFKEANIQPLTDRELDFILRSGHRINDVRKIYITSGKMEVLKLNDDVYFLGQRWKVIKRDYRPWHDYVKLIVDRFDNQ